MTFPSEEEHATAIKAFLTSVGANPLDLDEVKRDTQDRYTEVHLTAKVGGRGRLGASSGVRGIRVALRPVATKVTNVRELLSRIDQLEDVVLTVGDYTTTGLARDAAASTLITQDGDSQKYHALRTFTYAI